MKSLYLQTAGTTSTVPSKITKIRYKPLMTSEVPKFSKIKNKDQKTIGLKSSYKSTPVFKSGKTQLEKKIKQVSIDLQNKEKMKKLANKTATSQAFKKNTPASGISSKTGNININQLAKSQDIKINVDSQSISSSTNSKKIKVTTPGRSISNNKIDTKKKQSVKSIQSTQTSQPIHTTQPTTTPFIPTCFSNPFIKPKTIPKEKEPSEIFSSINTFQTLFKVKDKEPKKIVSPSQLKELDTLNQQLNIIKTEPNCNIISADMLDTTDPILTSSEKDKKASINEEILKSSHQRLQTYKLLLDVISKKFKEIKEIVENDMNNTNTNTNNNKISELHSKIEFTDIYDYEDDMQEKSNLIIPMGSSKTEPNQNCNISNFKIPQDVTTSINSDLLRTFAEYDENNFVSFFSNEMMSFFQSNSNTNNSVLTNNSTVLYQKNGVGPQIPIQSFKTERNKKCSIF